MANSKLATVKAKILNQLKSGPKKLPEIENGLQVNERLSFVTAIFELADLGEISVNRKFEIEKRVRANGGVF